MKTKNNANSGVKKKKGLRRKILAFVLAFTRVFRPETRLYSRLGARSVFWVGTGHEMHSGGAGPVTFFWATILAWKGTFLAWGARPRNAPRGAGPVHKL